MQALYEQKINSSYVWKTLYFMKDTTASLTPQVIKNIAFRSHSTIKSFISFFDIPNSEQVIWDLKMRLRLRAIDKQLFDVVKPLFVYSEDIYIGSLIEKVVCKYENHERDIDAMVIEFRKALRELVGNNAMDYQSVYKMQLVHVANRVLLSLAEKYPFNDSDFLTYDAIADDVQIVVTTGHQFNIYSLLEYNNKRPLRAEESPLAIRSLFNPLTNNFFSTHDSFKIIKKAEELGIKDRIFALGDQGYLPEDEFMQQAQQNIEPENPNQQLRF